MRRGQPLIWIIIAGVVAAVAVVIVVIEVTSGTSPNAASSPASTRAHKSAPVVTPKTSSTSSIAYLSDLHPSGDLAELVNPGPAKISGSIYPKSISFYCNVGDPTPFPIYKPKHNARRFQATIGLPAGSPAQFHGIIRLIGDGHTLQTFSVSVAKPKTVNVSVRGLRTFQLECFGSGNSYTGGEAVGVQWGNARFSGGQ
jgi:hypothetical protein